MRRVNQLYETDFCGGFFALTKKFKIKERKNCGHFAQVKFVFRNQIFAYTNLFIYKTFTSKSYDTIYI